MKVIYDRNEWKEKEIVATIGFFDGVHPGHRFLLREMLELAKVRKLPSAVITFPVHPRIVLQSDYQPKLLNSFDEKLELLSKTGIDYVIVMDFTPALAALTAQTFITDVLSAQWHVSTLLIGHDHRFGHQRAEGFEQYVAYGRACGMEIVKATSYSEKGVAVSSSAIRRLIERGDVETASHLLGYYYRLKGHVVGGHKVGRLIGFPTANIAVDEKFKVIPQSGSYAVWIKVDNKRYKGMLYIGSRPTVNNGNNLSIEVNIFDFSADIYNQPITVEFVKFIREDMKFNSLDELREQMEADRCAARTIDN